MPRVNAATSLSPSNDAAQSVDDLSRLCDLLDQLRADVALLDAAGLHDVAARLEAYEKIVRRVVYATITEIGTVAA